jgi:hypothetical protein
MSTHPIPTVEGAVVAALPALIEDEIVVHVVPAAKAVVAIGKWTNEGSV